MEDVRVAIDGDRAGTGEVLDTLGGQPACIDDEGGASSSTAITLIDDGGRSWGAWGSTPTSVIIPS